MVRAFLERPSAVRPLLALISLLCVKASSVPAWPAPQRFEYSEAAMGVRARIVLYAEDEASARLAAESAFNRIARLEDVMSDYRQDSELMRLCRQSGGPPVRVSRELFYILRKSLDLSRRSNGAFDVTVGPAVRLWRKARQNGKLPSAEELSLALKLVGWQNIVLDPVKQTVQLKVPGMQLDLGGIAKGYACDEAIRVLRRHGIASALVELGGDIVVSGPPPGQKGWRVEVANATDLSCRQLVITNAAVSSSGDTEQFVEIGGTRYSHIVDPRTGLGLTERIAVTVIAPTGVLSDGLATAVSVLGADSARPLLAQYPRVSAYIRRAPTQ